jgi:hypothetical protein
VSIHACPPRSGLPEAVAAVPESCDAALVVNPHQGGNPLPRPLAGRHGARHGTYRVVNRIVEYGSIVTSSTSATARRSPTACNADDRRPAPASRLILPMRTPNHGNHHRVRSLLTRSAALKNAAGGLDS